MGNPRSNELTISDYFNNLDPRSLAGRWRPVGQWHAVHGDTLLGGTWCMQTMATLNKNNKVQVFDSGKCVKALTYDTKPSFGQIVEDIKEDILAFHGNINEIEIAWSLTRRD